MRGVHGTSGVQLFFDRINCSLPGSFVHQILQARILEWVSIPSSSASSWLRDRTSVSSIARRFFNVEPPEKLRWWERRFKRNCAGKHNNIRHFVRKVTVIQDYFWFGWRRNGTIQKHFWSGKKKVSNKLWCISIKLHWVCLPLLPPFRPPPLLPLLLLRQQDQLFLVFFYLLNVKTRVIHFHLTSSK